MNQLDLNSADADGLVDSLNILLDNLDIPIELESPYDLTPSLLLAILESTLKTRLPLSDKLRQAQSPQSRVEAVKIFLGVLGNDVLQIDLSAIDPRRVARGEWEEVVYMGYLLVRVAKRVGMLEPDGFDIVDLEPDPTTSIHLDSEMESLPPISTPVSRTPTPSPPREPLFVARRQRASLTILSPSTPSIMKPLKSDSQVPRPPERQSTPPISSARKPSYMIYRPHSSPPEGTHTPAAELSICSCNFEEDVTRSTAHCDCEIHGSEEGLSASESTPEDVQPKRRNKTVTSVDVTSRENPSRGGSKRTLHARFESSG